MKIENLGVRITDIPGTESINIVPDDASAQDVSIVVTFIDTSGDAGEVNFGLHEFREFIEACHLAEQQASAMAMAPADE